MSKLKDLVSRGVRLIVTDADAEAAAEEPRERELAADLLDVEPPRPVTRSQVAADVPDFGAVYAEAGIEPPPHGYGVDKAGEMLENKRLATLGREVRATAVLAALEAAGAPIRDVIQDAVRRDKALDAFEAAKLAEVQELRAKTEARVQAIRDELDAVLRAKNAEIESLKTAAEAAAQALAELQEKKRREEERLHGIVAHFIEGGDNPITKSGAGAGPPAADPPARDVGGN